MFLINSLQIMIKKTVNCLTLQVQASKIMTHFNPYAEIAQLVEHTTENCGVLGPIPSLGTNKTPLTGVFCFISTFF
jgi:hypothetical protein